MSQRPGRTFPFSAIVGQDTLKLALTLNAVDPRVGGVLIRGHRGTAKSTAVRGLAHVLPQIEAALCAYGCDPREPARACAQCRDAEAPSAIERPVRIVELPVSATEDRLVGTLDLGAVLGQGEVAFQPGLLAAANRGILYVDEVNLLDDHLVDVLLDAAAAGVNTVEREGISVSHPARFILVGTMNPEEGELRPQLIDRFGLCVDVTACEDPADRVEIVRRRQAFEDDIPAFAAQWELADRELQARITAAQQRVGDVVLPEDVVWAIAQLAVLARVEGHRADAVMARAAAAHAAMHGRTRVELLDVERVAPLVLAHRAAADEIVDSSVPALTQRLAAALHDQAAEPDAEASESDPAAPGDGQAALAFTDPETPVFESSAPTPAIAVSTTRADVVSSGRRDWVSTNEGSGRVVGARPGVPRSGGELAVTATMKSAAVRAAGSDAGFSVGREDLHRKVVKRQTGASIVFCVDASGSMGVTDRLTAATAVIVDMLTQAYQRRDRVGLVTFRGRGAEVVLPLTASVELAKSRLRNVASGGSTPIAAGVVAAVELLDTEKRRRPEAVRWLVLVTDGRANVGAGTRLGVDEAQAQVRAALGKGVRVLVVDTAAAAGDRSPARELADSCGAAYASVREGDAAALGEAVADAV